MKTLIIAATTVLTLSTMASAANTVVLEQTGRINKGVVTQSGKNNDVFIDQFGNKNFAGVNQVGKNNGAGVFQGGGGVNKAKIKQRQFSKRRLLRKRR